MEVSKAIFCMTISLMLGITNSKVLYTSSISSDPSDVSHLDTTLILVVQPETPIPAGGLVQLKLPSSGEVSFKAEAFTEPPYCELLGLATPEVVSCVIENDTDGVPMITWTTIDPVDAFNFV